MRNSAIRRIGGGFIVALAVLVLAPVARSDSGHSHGGHSASHGTPSYSAGEPGDPKKPARIVLVTMRETADGKMVYQPSKLDVKAGEQVRFVLTNAGELEHEFVLASEEDNRKHAEEMRANPGMAHDDEANGKMLAPKSKGEFVWRFTKTGAFEFACLIPGHREAGMVGTVTVR